MGLFRVAGRVCVCDYVMAVGETLDAPSSSPCDPRSGRERSAVSRHIAVIPRLTCTVSPKAAGCVSVTHADPETQRHTPLT